MTEIHRGLLRRKASTVASAAGALALVAAGLMAAAGAAAASVSTASVPNASSASVPAVATGSDTPPTWSPAQTPTPKGTDDSLSAVSCASATFCYAVGDYLPGESDFSVLLDEWNGTKWIARTSKKTGNGDLTAISCTSPSSCIAVGSSPSGPGPLVESFNGTKWTSETVPLPSGNEGGSLAGVSCLSATSCTAVGSYANSSGTSETLAEMLSGTSWTDQTPANPSGATASYLTSVSCPSTGTCTAVGVFDPAGGSEATLAELWSGGSWTVQSTSNPSPISLFQSVSCGASFSCTAVGESYDEGSGAYQMLAEESSGGTWTVQSLPSPTGSLTTSLEGVSCPSPTTCTAVGSYQLTDGSNLTLVETSSGSSWSIQPMTRTKGEVFADVSCYGTSGCEAIGDHFETSGEKTLAEGWSGTSWSVQSIPSSTGSEADSLAGISCFSMSTCTAVGNYSTLGSPSQAALAEGWNGAKWALQKTPATAAALDSVSCPATDWCTAVGSDPDTSSTLVQAWNGKKWSVETTPAAPGSPADLNGVSCVSATDCTAVGYYNAGESYATLVEAWNGTKWSIVASPSPGGNGFDDFSELTGVWCFSSTSCVAVGTDGDFSSLTTLVEIWNGSTWTVQTSPNPTSASESTLSAISCASATDCMAVGVYTGTSGNLTLAEIWNGTTWAVKSTPNPAGASDSQLVGVSCDSSTCAAVGQSTAGDGTVTPLAEGFDGTSWTLESVATPAGASSGYFSAVACPAGAPCTAVGQYTDAAGGTHALVENQS